MAEKSKAGIWPKVVLIVLSLLPIGLGALALYFWHHPNSLFSDFDRILLHYNAALAFILFGLAFIFLNLGSNKFPAAAGLLIFAYSSIVIAEFYFGLDSWISRPLFLIHGVGDSWVQTKIRMGTTISLGLTGLSLFLMSIHPRMKHPFLFIAILSSLLGVRSFMAIFQYFVGTNMPVSWFHSMSLMAAFGFLSIGAGILVYIYHEKPADRGSIHWLPLTSMISAMAITFSFWQVKVVKDGERINQLLTMNSLNLSHQIKLNMDTRLQTLLSLTRTWSLRGRPSKNQWLPELESVLEGYNGFQMLGWADSDYHLQWLVTEKGLDNNPSHAKSIEQFLTPVSKTSWKANEFMLLGPQKFNGETQFVALAPILKKGDFKGLVLAGINEKNFFSAALLEQSINKDFVVKIDFGGNKKYEMNMPADPENIHWGAPTLLNFNATVWKMLVAPNQSFLVQNHSHLADATLVIGILISFLVGLIIYYLQSLHAQNKAMIAANVEVQKLATMVGSAHDAIIGVEMNGIISVWNNGAENLFGYTAAEIKGRPLSLLFPANKEGALKSVVEKIKEGKYIQTFETIHVRKDGQQVHVSVTKSPIRDLSGRIVGLSVVAQDVTRRYQAEEEVRQANVRLESRVLERTRELNGAIQRMQEEIQARKRIEKELAMRADELATSNRELEQFAVVASHDLQEPLRKVSSYGELLSQRYRDKLDDKGQKFIDYMTDGVSRMQNLIKGLLSYGRVGRRDLDLHDLELKQIIDQAIRDLEEVIKSSDAEIVCDPMPVVHANPIQMGQLIQNLISNAIKFSGDRKPEIHISAKQTGDMWTIAIADKGIGIENQHIERIFQIFQRLHSRNEFPGTGIGLAICKKIVDRHGGRIWVESKKGEGSTFLFTIPLKMEPSPLSEMALN